MAHACCKDGRLFWFLVFQIQDISAALATETDYVDWRRLLLALTWPIPTPTQAQLLDSLQHFRDMDQKGTGFVTREQYDRVGISSPSVFAGNDLVG